MLKSPVDEASTLEPVAIEPGFGAMRCAGSGGLWIRPAQYWTWREGAEAYLTEHLPSLGADEPGCDSGAGKRCPEDGYFLIRHRVGHGLDFHVDRCGHCGGIWLDRGEWDALKRESLHNDLHLIFTSAWQAQVRWQLLREAQEQRLTARLGPADHEELNRITKWVMNHPQRHMILAHLHHHAGGGAEEAGVK